MFSAKVSTFVIKPRLFRSFNVIGQVDRLVEEFDYFNSKRRSIVFLHPLLVQETRSWGTLILSMPEYLLTIP